MTEYQRKKEAVRQMAIEWQHNFDQHNYSWFELYMQQEKFRNLARQFGLRKEFQENGII